MTNEKKYDFTEYNLAFIGDETAWQEINDAMSNHFKDGRHVTWNSDWVIRVAGLKSPDRELEIQRGIANLAEVDALILRGDYEEILDEPLDVICTNGLMHLKTNSSTLAKAIF